MTLDDLNIAISKLRGEHRVHDLDDSYYHADGVYRAKPPDWTGNICEAMRLRQDMKDKGHGVVLWGHMGISSVGHPCLTLWSSVYPPSHRDKNATHFGIESTPEAQAICRAYYFVMTGEYISLEA